MPLSWNEIRSRALIFSKEWADETSEDAEAKSFWDGFFNVFGITRRRLASFEAPVKKDDGKGGFIDLLWKGVLLVEHKSRGKDLDRAAKQALDYFPGLKERDLPRYVLVSDFARLRLHDLDENTTHEFTLAELHKHVRHFGFMAGYQTRSFGQEDPVNIKAAEHLGRLHEIKGQTIYAYVSLKAGIAATEELRAILKKHVRSEIGPIAVPEFIQFSDGLPKTRSGKIMRRILRKIAAGHTEAHDFGDTSTLADPSVVDTLVTGSRELVK